MDIFSKIKKFEEADYFNQNLSNVLIDEDRDKFTIGHELIEEADYFNQNLSNVLIDEDRDKFAIGHELIEESDYFNSNLSNVLLDASSDIFADSLALDEESDFFNQNLNNALIEDVDLDSIVDTLSLVETAKQQSAVKYYKVEITKTPSTYTTATLSNGRFNGLRFKETTSTFETNAISENVVFTDSNNHDINAVVEYLNGRTESNNNSYNPSAFFVEDVSQSWGGTPWNTIEGDTNEDLVYRITFQTKIQRSDIESLTFDDINDDNVPVKFKLFTSNDLETWELLQDTDISYDSELNLYSYEKSDTVIKYDDKYKIVLTASESVGDPPSMSDFSFENLIYSECLSPRSATATSENIVFTDSKGNEYNCTISVSSRWYDNRQDDYAPHNVFAPADKRVSYAPVITASRSEWDSSDTLTCTIKFTDDINIDLIKNLTVFAGWNFGRYTDRYVKHINCKLYDGKNNLIYENTKDNEENRGNYAMVFLDSIDESKLETYSLSDPADTWKIVLTTNPDTSPEGGLALGKFTELVYVECLTPQSYDNTSEDIVFTDGENNYNCTVSVNGRFPHKAQDYYAPHNFFAPSNKRVCPASNIYCYYGERLIVTIKFTDPIAYSKIQELGFRFGHEANEYVPDAVQYDLYNGDNELAYTTTKLRADADSNRDIIITAELYTM